MLSSKRFLSLLLCTVMLLASAVGCNDSGDTQDMTAASETTVAATEADTETETTTEPGVITVTTEAEPEPDPVLDYEWKVEPGIYSGEIRQIPGIVKTVNIGLVLLDDKYLVDFGGNIKYTFPDKSEDQTEVCSFCRTCSLISTINGLIEPENYETVGHVGHGGSHYPSYIYDSETGFICYYGYGAYNEVTENIPFAIVAEGKRRPATTEDNVMTDFAYDMTGLYGIVVDSKLVVPFEYEDAAGYDEGDIAKLKKDGKWALFNSEGEMILGNEYLDFHPSSSGYIALNRDGKWGYADLEGNIVVDHVLDEALQVYCGMAWAKTNAGWGVIKVGEPEALTEEEAKQIIRDKFSRESSSLVSVDIIPNGKKYYESVGYGFDFKVFYENGYVRSGSYFVSCDGTIFGPQYVVDGEIYR